MKLFQGLFAKGGIKIGAPVSGELVSIKDVSDATFSEEILGKGAAIIPSDNRFYAPVDGTVTTIFPTGHAAAVTGDDGVEILIHIGLDTVKLNGKYFTSHVGEGQKVKKGDLLLEADLEEIKREGYDTITPVVVCNYGEFAEFTTAELGEISKGDEIIRLQK